MLFAYQKHTPDVCSTEVEKFFPRNPEKSRITLLAAPSAGRNLGDFRASRLDIASFPQRIIPDSP
jgi:hypothetical protein